VQRDVCSRFWHHCSFRLPAVHNPRKAAVVVPCAARGQLGVRAVQQFCAWLQCTSTTTEYFLCACLQLFRAVRQSQRHGGSSGGSSPPDLDLAGLTNGGSLEDGHGGGGPPSPGGSGLEHARHRPATKGEQMIGFWLQDACSRGCAAAQLLWWCSPRIVFPRIITRSTLAYVQEPGHKHVAIQHKSGPQVRHSPTGNTEQNACVHCRCSARSLSAARPAAAGATARSSTAAQQPAQVRTMVCQGFRGPGITEAPPCAALHCQVSLLTSLWLADVQGGQQRGRSACSDSLFYERAAEGPAAGAAAAWPELPTGVTGGDASPPVRLSRQTLASAAAASGAPNGAGAAPPNGGPDWTLPAARAGVTRHAAAGRPGLHSHAATARRHAWTKFFRRAFGGPSAAPSQD